MSNIKFINQAQKMLTEDYTNKHTAEYNSWLNAHKSSWMQPHTIVPFPPFIISGALAPFKAVVRVPTEEEIVTKAIELYNQANPVPIASKVESNIEPSVTLIQPVDITEAPEVVEVEELIEPTTLVEETPVVEPIIEELSESNNVEAIPKIKPYEDEIYKIYQTPEPKPMDIEDRIAEFTAYIEMEEALKVVPQPSEELAKVSKPGKIFPSVMEKLQSITSKWTSNGSSNV
jgi:hypothetical protein